MNNQSLFNIINPAAHIVYSEKGKQIRTEILQAKQEKNMTTDEFIFHITHHANNLKKDNGRINSSIGDNEMALSVSPYSKTFDYNIEEKIMPLVNGLKAKRYLTYSSCESHGLSFRRFVGVAFADEESRGYVFNFINSLGLPGVKMYLKDSVSNIVIDVKASGTKPHPKIIGVDKRVDRSNEERQGETKAFNIQFHRTYNSYCFLEIVISQAVFSFEDFPRKIFKNFPYSIYLAYLRIFKMEQITKKITEEINSKNFKKYKY